MKNVLKYIFYFFIIMFIVTTVQVMLDGTPNTEIQNEIKEEQALFKKEKSRFLKDVSSLYNEANYREALLLANSYKNVKDEDLEKLKSKIKDALSKYKGKDLEKLKAKAKEIKLEKERKEKAPLYLAKLKKLPASKYEENLELYEKLLKLYPDNKKYDKKVKYYGQKVLEKQLYYGERPTQNKWDGSYYEVEKYLKRVMNDPSSLEFKGCTQVYKQDDGWLVGCQYRGKNGFGAKVLEAKWFTIRQSQVVKTEAGNTYKW